MKKSLLVILFTFLLAVSAACTQDGTTKKPDHEVDESGQVEEETNEQDEEQEEESSEKANGLDEDENKTDPNIEGNEQDSNEDEGENGIEQNKVQMLKDMEIVGKDTNELKKLLGEPTVDYKDSVMHAWQYDFTVDSYSFTNELIAVDVQGLENGMMEVQLMVYYEDNVAASYSIYYFSEEEEEIMQYRETEYGSDVYPAMAD